jgi:XTP/dITP diphosphohydrolase
MTELIFASANPNKAKEIQAALPENFKVITMKEAGFAEDIPEPYQTMEENAQHKARTVARTLQVNCFAEDTGLETDALQGAPGVRSARYAGDEANDRKNIEKLLQELDNNPQRKARFKTVIVLILNGEEYFFTGICEGEIQVSPSGSAGFGYDPIFIPTGASKTFAEMTLEEKNTYSHRKKALSKMIAFLKERTNAN